MGRTLFIGRFQPFHRGHLHAIEQAQQEHSIIVGIGSSNRSRTQHNPLTYEERETVLQNCLGSARIEPIPDHDNDSDWMDHIEERFDLDQCISGNDHVRRLFTGRGYTVHAPEYLEPDTYSGTRIREQAAAEKPWQDLVPECANDQLTAIGFEQIIQDIYENEG